MTCIRKKHNRRGVKNNPLRPSLLDEEMKDERTNKPKITKVFLFK